MSRKQKHILFRILLAAVLAAVVWLLPLHGLWQALAFALPYLVIGYDVLWGSARNLLHGQVLDEKLLMSLATVGAFVIGKYPEAAAIMLFYQVGELLQSIAVGKSRKSIAALMDIRPDEAVVLRSGEERTVSPEEVQIGETIVVRPGERLPLDGVILEGSTTVNTAALTGESLPVDKHPGDRVLSGTINQNGLIFVKTDSVFSESTASRILELVENASEKKSRAENFITRFARWYTPCVVGSALLLAVLPPLLFGQDWSSWLERALIFLVDSCPCALVVSVPLTFFSGLGRASRDGILIKGANYLEMLAKVDTLVFDKTGTVTEGSFTVTEVQPLGISRERLLEIAAMAESYSSHPVAVSVRTAYRFPVDRSRLGEITEQAGMGVQAQIDGMTYYVGSSRLMAQKGIAMPESNDTAIPGTVIHIASEGSYLGRLLISDRIKPEAAPALKALRKLGIRKTVMLTGDNQVTAKSVAQTIGADRFRAGLLPAQKVEAVEDILAEGASVAFVGDGINDAPVLTRADVGIAMGALGSDAAIESADVVLMDDRLSRLPLAVRIARFTMQIVRQNIVFALAVKLVILVLGACGLANMWLALFGDVGVTVLAVFNALRALYRHNDSWRTDK